MDASTNGRTAIPNGRLWGARALEWAELQEPQFTRAYEAVFERTGLGPGSMYCDLGCGSGLAASIASARGARVTGMDAAEHLLSIARARVPGADFRQGDLEDLPFENDTFDVVTGFNSFQYAGNPTTALAEARRITKRDGRVMVMTWGPPDGMDAASLVAALKPMLPAPSVGAPGPFALSDRAALIRFAESAGLRPLEVQDVECTWNYADVATATRAFGSAGVAVRAAENTSQDAVDRAHEAALKPFATPDGSIRLHAVFRWLTAAA